MRRFKNLRPLRQGSHVSLQDLLVCCCHHDHIQQRDGWFSNLTEIVRPAPDWAKRAAGKGIGQTPSAATVVTVLSIFRNPKLGTGGLELRLL